MSRLGCKTCFCPLDCFGHCRVVPVTEESPNVALGIASGIKSSTQLVSSQAHRSSAFAWGLDPARRDAEVASDYLEEIVGDYVRLCVAVFIKNKL